MSGERGTRVRVGHNRGAGGFLTHQGCSPGDIRLQLHVQRMTGGDVKLFIE